jgi:hypothetical protein
MKVYKCTINASIPSKAILTEFANVLEIDKIYIGVLESPENVRVLLDNGKMQGFFPERF